MKPFRRIALALSAALAFAGAAPTAPADAAMRDRALQAAANHWGWSDGIAPTQVKVVFWEEDSATMVNPGQEAPAWNCPVGPCVVLPAWSKGWWGSMCPMVVHEYGHLNLGFSWFLNENPSDPAHSPDPTSIMYYRLTSRNERLAVCRQARPLARR